MRHKRREPQVRLRPGTYIMRLTRRFALIGAQKIVKKELFFQLFSNLPGFQGFGRAQQETAHENDEHKRDGE